MPWPAPTEGLSLIALNGAVGLIIFPWPQPCSLLEEECGKNVKGGAMLNPELFAGLSVTGPGVSVDANAITSPCVIC